MTIVNRLLALGFLGVLGASACAIIAVEMQLVTFATLGHDVDTPLAAIVSATDRWRVVAIAAAVALAALVGLLAELRPPARRDRLVSLRTDGPGTTEIDLKALDTLAERSALQVAGVERVAARVVARTDALTVDCRAVVTPSSAFPDAGRAIERRVIDQLGHTTGIPVSIVRVRTLVARPRGARHVR